MDQIFDRFERLFKSWVSGSVDSTEELFGRTQARRPSGNSDYDDAMSELDDYLDTGRTETEAREREKARRDREAASRRASATSTGRPSGPPAALVQAYRSLGLSHGVPFQYVPAAYRRLLMQTPPDRNSATPEPLTRSTELPLPLHAASHTIEPWTATGSLHEN